MFKIVAAFLFLGAFAKLRKATVTFVMSLRPSVRMRQLGCHRTDLYLLDDYYSNIYISK